MSKIVVSRLQNYPVDSPQSWVVGFTVTSDNNRSFFIDTSVDYDLANSDKEAVDVAYNNLKLIINQKLENLKQSQPIIGQTYDPVDE
jgi:hypothetical protein